MHQTEQHIFQGVHILGEIYGVEASLLDNVSYLEELLRKGIALSGATLCGIQSKKFEPSGVTILALLSESHASIHTYPQDGALFFDAFTCGMTCRPERIAEVLLEGLNAKEHNLQKVIRGEYSHEDHDHDGCCGEDHHHHA